MPLVFMTLPTHAAKVTNDLTHDSNGLYDIRIEASQWEYAVFDLNADPSHTHAMYHSIHFPDIGSQYKVQFHIYSRDVQHGFSINEWGFSYALIRPTPGQEFGGPIEPPAHVLPSQDTTYSAFCHIFCGLGHPDMKLKLVFGNGSPNYGLYVFWGAVALNLGILALSLRSILTKLTLMAAV